MSNVATKKITTTDVHRKYEPFAGVDLPNRRWPDNRITSPPIWCSVDLRDGNQALINPMNADRKLRMWDALINIGFKEIEVGFPAASQTDFDFIRHIIDHKKIPQDVTIQVLTQCREHLIERTFEAIKGAHSVIIHIYNSTSPQQRVHVFNNDEKKTIDVAVTSAKQVAQMAKDKTHGDGKIVYQYSPESFTQTEPEFTQDICIAVLEAFNPSPSAPMIINLPSTVEIASPNFYADQIERFINHFPYKDRTIISVHPHNDRGTAVAAAELALMAGAQRVEGTLFGNGERTGNVDLITLSMNMVSQGVKTNLNFHDMPALVKTAEYCNDLDVGARHPYAGKLVFTAFSGSHQDAIRKCLAAREKSNASLWEIPYLPIDPHDVNGHYEEIIRINSQSGKGGIAFVMETDHGLWLPKDFQIALAKHVQRHAEKTGAEISSTDILDIFKKNFVDVTTPIAFQRYTTKEVHGKHREIEVDITVNHSNHTIKATGNGPIDAYYQALVGHFTHNAEAKAEAEVSKAAASKMDGNFPWQLTEYSEHSVALPHNSAQPHKASKATAAAYVTLTHDNGERVFGVGLKESIVEASLIALTVAMNKALQQENHNS